jgi:hypothetical protein
MSEELPVQVKSNGFPARPELHSALHLAWQLLPPDVREEIQHYWHDSRPELELVASLDGHAMSTVGRSGRGVRLSAARCALMPENVLVGVIVRELAYAYCRALVNKAGHPPMELVGRQAVEAEWVVSELLSEWELHPFQEFVNEWIESGGRGGHENASGCQ